MADPEPKEPIDSLGRIPVGASAVIRRLAAPRRLALRLMEMGLLPGTRVTLTRVAPLGDPLLLRVRDSALSLRRGEVLGVQVDGVELSAEPTAGAVGT